MRSFLLLPAILFLASCQYDPFASTYTTERPAEADIIGNYQLVHKTIDTPEFAALNQVPSTIQLKPDSTFSAKNVPVTLFPSFESKISSGSGRWKIEKRGTISTGFGTKTHWGLRLEITEAEIAFPGFTHDKAPYGLVFTIGDPDSGTALFLEKQK